MISRNIGFILSFDKLANGVLNVSQKKIPIQDEFKQIILIDTHNSIAFIRTPNIRTDRRIILLHEMVIFLFSSHFKTELWKIKRRQQQIAHTSHEKWKVKKSTNTQTHKHEQNIHSHWQRYVTAWSISRLPHRAVTHRLLYYC